MSTKKILGLDLGVGSIGWALIETENDIPKQILGMGSRIVPLTKDDSDQFQKGQAITKNADRTQKRTMRKGFDRFQLRRAYLTKILQANSMLPENGSKLWTLQSVALWQLRADAACKEIDLKELGRVLYHLNQKRGYKHAKADVSGDSKQTAYVATVNQRYADLQKTGLTIGQYMYEQLKASEVVGDNGVYYTFRVKDKVYPRGAYVEEYDRIMAEQKKHHPEVLTDELIDELRNRVIFYQRPLKSCKHLVSLCEFEMRPIKTKDGRIVYKGPKVAPRTSPLSQLCAIWETVNNIKLTNRKNEEYPMTLAERQALVNHLMTNEKLTLTQLQKILGITKRDGWYGGKAIGKGMTGNKMLCDLTKALGGKYDQWLQFNLPTEQGNIVDVETGEIYDVISEQIEREPLQQLWHTLYSISDKEELREALRKRFDITDDEVVDALFALDFVKPGYANKSTKFMRKELPLLMQGYMYSEACALLGINHSASLTKEQNDARKLKPRLAQLQKNELRQPVVEKILNQMINVVNALKDEYGEIDCMRVELARELKQSLSEREETYRAINRNEKKNAEYAAKIKELGVRPSRSRVQKYHLWLESNHSCFYCGKQVNAAEFLSGADVEVEHIIPRSVLFDDSFSNKVCACRQCNQEKGNLTAMDYIKTKSQEVQDAYLRRVEEAYASKNEETHISKTKRDHLLWTLNDIPQDFIDRQLRQSQYIAKKAVEILSETCREVNATSGIVTDFLRHLWGYDEVLHDLNRPVFEKVGLTEMKDGHERIKGWTKRMDHRHHAIDALTIALTRQSYIQRLNTLNASREEMYAEVESADMEYKEKRSLLEKWVMLQPHFTTEQVAEKADGILISFRAGKRVTTPAKRAIYVGGKRQNVQTGLQVPRGALTEETIYGKTDGRFVVKYPLDHPSMKPEEIVDPTIRQIVMDRLAAFGGNAKKAFATPLYSDKAQTMQIRSVRCFTRLQENSMTIVKRDEHGQPIGYAKLGNNHHIALYKDKEGQMHEQVVTFMQAVMRKQAGLPIVITDPKAVWTGLMDRDDVADEVLKMLPEDGWTYVVSMQANEMFILGLTDSEFETAMQEKDYRTLNKHLYRVQKLASSDYYFRYHLETSVDDKYNGEKNEKLSLEMQKVMRVRSFSSLSNLNPIKVRINVLGEISL